MTSAEAPPQRFVVQRLLIGVAFLGVAALTAGAFVLSYDDLRELALAGMGGRNERYAWVYPAMYDALVVTGLLAVFVARNSHWFTRALRWGLLLLLVAGAIAISVQRSVKGFGAIEGDWLDAGVASAPWIAALLAIWLWMSMFRHLRTAAHARTAARRRRGPRKPPAHAKSDPGEIVPGFRPEIREEQEPEEFRRPYEVQTAPDPGHDATVTHPEPHYEDRAEPTVADGSGDGDAADGAGAGEAAPEPRKKSRFDRRRSKAAAVTPVDPVPELSPEPVTEADDLPEHATAEPGESDTREDIPVIAEDPPTADPFVGVREIPRRNAVAPPMDTVEDFPTDDLYRDPKPSQEAVQAPPRENPDPPRDLQVPSQQPVDVPVWGPVDEAAHEGGDLASQEAEPPREDADVPAQRQPDPYTDTVEDALPRPPLHLPTDVKLVGRAQDTQPDFPAPVEDRAEDPDGGDDWAAYAPEWNPPSGSLRSGPVPPEE